MTILRRIFCLALALIMISSSSVFVDSQNVKAAPVAEESTAIEEGMPDLQVTELNAETPLIYLNQTSWLTLSLANQGDAMAQQVEVVVTDIKPDKTEEIITTLHFGAIKDGKEKSRVIEWLPEEEGTHYLELNISARQQGGQEPSDQIEMENIIQSSIFSVTPPRPSVDHYSDWIITDYQYRENVNEILWDYNLIITSTGYLEFGENVNLIIRNSDDSGSSGIHVQEHGIFEINGGSKTTQIDRSMTFSNFGFKFLNEGTIDFTGAGVFYTHGSTDTSLPGGIQNLKDSTCIINNCDLLDADTHTIYASEAEIQIKGSETVIGNHVPTSRATGHGIFINGANPVIEDVTIQHQELDAIHIENAISDAPITASGLQNYAGEEYDYKMTYEGQYKPKVIAANGAVYLSYIDQYDEHLYFKKSIDNGVSWSNEQLIYTSGEFIGSYDLAGYLDNIAIVWEEWSDISGSAPDLYAMFSWDGGTSWTTPYYIGQASDPAVDVEGNQIYIAHRYWQWSEPGWSNVMKLVWGEDPDDPYTLQEETFPDPLPTSTQGLSGIPDIAVADDVIHLVIDDYNSRSCWYWRSIDDGQVWTDPFKIAIMYDELETGHMDIDANSEKVAFVWTTPRHDFSSYLLRCQYAYATDWAWTHLEPFVRESDEMMLPNVELDSNNNLYIVYQDEIDEKIHYVVYDDIANLLVPDMILTPGTDNFAIHASLAISNSDNIYLVWEDARDGNTDIYAKRAFHSVLKNLDITTNTETGISALDSDIYVVNSRISNNKNSIESQNSNVQLRNTDIELSSDYDISSSGTGLLTAIDCSFDKLNTQIVDTAHLEVHNTLQLTVLNDFGNPIPDAQVDISDYDGTPVFSGLTGSGGQIKADLTMYAEESSGKSYESPHLISATFGTYSKTLPVLAEIQNADLEVSIYLGEDSDNDGLTDGEENMIGTSPVSPNDPGMHVKYEYNFQTRDYYCWDNFQNNYISKDLVVARRGSKITFEGRQDLGLTFEISPYYSGQTQFLPGFSLDPGIWYINLPDDCTIGKYMVYLNDTEKVPPLITTMDLNVIFDLPESPAISEDEISAYCYDDNSVEKDQVDAGSIYIGSSNINKYDLHCFDDSTMGPSILEYTLAGVGGIQEPMDASLIISRIVNQRIVWHTAQNDFHYIVDMMEKDCRLYFSYNGNQDPLNRGNAQIQDLDENGDPIKGKFIHLEYEVLSLTLNDMSHLAQNGNYINTSVPQGFSKQIVGHCMDYSAMFASMVRSLGIPSRITSSKGSLGLYNSLGAEDTWFHMANQIWLENPPSSYNVAIEDNWMGFDVQDGTIELEQLNREDWPLPLIDPNVDVLRSAGQIGNSIVDSIGVVEPRWNPDYKTSGKRKDINFDYTQYHMEIPVEGEVSGHMIFNDRDFYLLDLTSSGPKTIEISKISDGISAKLYINPQNSLGENYPRWDGVRTYDNYLYEGTSITLPGGLYHYVMIAPTEDSLPYYFENYDNDGGICPGGNYGTYTISVA